MKNLNLNFPKPSSQLLDNFSGYPQYPESEEMFTKYQYEIETYPEIKSQNNNLPTTDILNPISDPENST